ncbi:hypothetical protein [Xenorhabdus griffiniae]|uniref:Uncharacterized protein n=1 Tax=Xenorhabdus griffiniae TaxID=351672 RepID=A0ABY9XEL3_9GAMM|nr:hypothetical protein [Xenorhabdus griffiniae]MBD1228960.1 hypothetical protein [Xenorhabdus griffiniae]MBE8588597.1 hypothetical protein [Xenorhabdus griffiniae]WMV71278.1 hypothetical protein QL128_13935 [Xenorhabdus griffiniae]WNH00954.1 hypothetical protein QL112_013940 [Xenorhabdus griffiniae]
MSNDVIEKINTTLKSAEELKSAGYHEIALDLNLCITILKRLAEYENMKPVACYNLMDGKLYKDISDMPADKTMFGIFLYPHPNK